MGRGPFVRQCRDGNFARRRTHFGCITIFSLPQGAIVKAQKTLWRCHYAIRCPILPLGYCVVFRYAAIKERAGPWAGKAAASEAECTGEVDWTKYQFRVSSWIPCIEISSYIKSHSSHTHLPKLIFVEITSHFVWERALNDRLRRVYNV
jgi:hypothetical protein